MHWLCRLLLKEQVEKQLDAELRFHLDQQITSYIASGLDPEEARRRAHLELGGLERVKEEVRQSHRGNFVQTLGQDVRFGFRTLRKSPGFTIVSVLTLALGIGANTAIFSVVYGVLLRPLPYPDSDRVVQLTLNYRGQLEKDRFSFGEYQYLREQDRWSQAIAAFTGSGVTLVAGGEPERVHMLRISADYFHVLGVRPFIGRDFLPEEDRGSGVPVALLSNGLWKRRFAGDLSMVGKDITLDGQPYAVIGVMPPGFESHPAVDLWAPLAQVAKTVGGGQNLTVLGRLKDGLTLGSAQARLDPVTEPLLRLNNVPDSYIRELRLVLFPFQKSLAAGVSQSLFILIGAVCSVLLIACANVANLLLARGTARAKEIAIRTSLGATRARLCRQLLTESVLLSGIGGACGLLLARVSLTSLLRFAPTVLPRVTEIGVDRWAFAFAFLLAFVMGILFGLAPAVQASTTDLNAVLKEGIGRGMVGPRRGRLRNALVIAEIAVSFVLLVGAALISMTLVNLMRTDTGFDAHHALSVEIWLNGSRYHSTAELASYYHKAVEAIERVPGVESASVVNAGQPLEMGGNLPILIRPPDQEAVDYRSISPEYFRTLGVALQCGRFFSEADNETAQPVAIVNETFVHRYLEGRDPLGQPADLGQMEHLRVIVGVVGDVKSFVGESVAPAVFVPAAQASFNISQLFDTWFPTHVLVRTTGGPLLAARAVENELRAADPSIPIGRVRSMDQVLSSTLGLQQFMLLLLSVFAGLALVLAAVGIYGVMSYSVVQRTAEIGLRVALGASRRNVLWLALRQGLLAALVGIAIGLAGSLALTRTLSSLLYGVRPSDPRMLLLCAAVLCAVTLLACFIPARRATGVDPLVALRYE